jgi:class 3 adenylate cyclase
VIGVRISVGEPCPLPEDPTLAAVATALDETGAWGWVVDASWRFVYVTDEHRLGLAGGGDAVPIVIGEHLLSEAALAVSDEWRTGLTDVEMWRDLFSGLGGLILADTPGGKDALRALVDVSLRDIVDNLSPASDAAVSFSARSRGPTGVRSALTKALRIRDESGALVGTEIVIKPSAGMTDLALMGHDRDLEHLARMNAMGRPARRPAAILFADLEGSSALSRELSTARFFALGRRMVRATDASVVAAGGLVGRHVGDGVVAFFPASVFESESETARACISAAQVIVAAMTDVALRSGLAVDDVVMRFGLHWGTTLYMGNIITTARSEVTALGDEVNETARIEACATGGKILASKALVERLNDTDAVALGIDPDHISYKQLADLPTATDKARRDAPSIAVCEI